MSAFVAAIVFVAAAIHSARNAILKSRQDHFSALFAQLAAAPILDETLAVFGARLRMLFWRKKKFGADVIVAGAAIDCVCLMQIAAIIADAVGERPAYEELAR